MAPASALTAKHLDLSGEHEHESGHEYVVPVAPVVAAPGAPVVSPVVVDAVGLVPCSTQEATKGPSLQRACGSVAGAAPVPAHALGHGGGGGGDCCGKEAPSVPCAALCCGERDSSSRLVRDGALPQATQRPHASANPVSIHTPKLAVGGPPWNSVDELPLPPAAKHDQHQTNLQNGTKPTQSGAPASEPLQFKRDTNEAHDNDKAAALRTQENTNANAATTTAPTTSARMPRSPWFDEIAKALNDTAQAASQAMRERCNDDSTKILLQKILDKHVDLPKLLDKLHTGKYDTLDAVAKDVRTRCANLMRHAAELVAEDVEKNGGNEDYTRAPVPHPLSAAADCALDVVNEKVLLVLPALVGAPAASKRSYDAPWILHANRRGGNANVATTTPAKPPPPAQPSPARKKLKPSPAARKKQKEKPTTQRSLAPKKVPFKGARGALPKPSLSPTTRHLAPSPTRHLAPSPTGKQLAPSPTFGAPIVKLKMKRKRK
ncbi:hypothetical protein NFJ02_12g08350 [Pycnococcus provasolii]